MTMQLLEREFPNDHTPLLRWLMFTASVGVRLRDRLVLRPLPSDAGERQDLHFPDHRRALPRGDGALLRAHRRYLARDGRRAARVVDRRPRCSKPQGRRAGGRDRRRHAPAAGLVAAHIRDLMVKAGLQGGRRLDQTLLLRVLADALRGSNAFGAFASDTLMKLGLLGTIIGFIMMLAPIAGLDPENARGDPLVDVADERRHGGRHVHDARRPRRLDPAQDPVQHARQRHGEDLRLRRRSHRGPCRLGARAGASRSLEMAGRRPNDRPVRPDAARGGVRSVQRRAVQGAADPGLPVLHRAAGHRPRPKRARSTARPSSSSRPDLAGQPSRRHRHLRPGSAWQHRLVPAARGRFHAARPRRPRRAQRFRRGQRREGADRDPAGDGQHPRHRRRRIHRQRLSLRDVRRAGAGHGDGAEAQPDGRGRPLRHHHPRSHRPSSGPRSASGSTTTAISSTSIIAKSR